MGTFNRDALLLECLKKLSALDNHIEGNYEVVVVNNYSTDNTHQALVEAKKFFKNPETLVFYSQPKFTQVHKTFTTSQLFLTRGVFSQAISDDDFLKIDSFVKNIYVLKNDKTTILSAQSSPGSGYNPTFPEVQTIHSTRKTIPELLLYLFMVSGFDMFEMPLCPSSIQHAPGRTFYEEYKHAMAIKAMTTGDIMVSDIPYYCRVDNHTYENVRNNKTASDDLQKYSSLNNLAAMEIMLSQLKRDESLLRINIDDLIAPGSSYLPMHVMVRHYAHHCTVSLKKNNFRVASHFERRLRLYCEEAHRDIDAFMMHTLAEAFLDWSNLFFMVDSIVTPFFDTDDSKYFFHACFLIDEAFQNKKKYTAEYDDQIYQSNTIFIVKNEQEKDTILANGFAYPGLIFVFEEVFDYYKVKAQPFNWDKIKDDFCKNLEFVLNK